MLAEIEPRKINSRHSLGKSKELAVQKVSIRRGEEFDICFRILKEKSYIARAGNLLEANIPVTSTARLSDRAATSVESARPARYWKLENSFR